MSLADNKVPTIAFQHIDKVYHVTAYFIMSVLWYIFFYGRFLKRHPNYRFNLVTILAGWQKTVALGAAAISFVTGALLELGQGFFSVNRNMDTFDMLANIFGIIVANLFLWIFSEKIKTDIP
jgi:VanZ family protein